MHVAPMPVQQQQQPASGHAFPGAPQEQSQQPKLHRVRILSSSPPRYVTRPLCLADSPYYVPDLHARSPPLPLPAQSSTSPTPSCSAAGQRPLQLAPSASASASGLGFQEAVPLMLPLASQVLSAGASGGGGSGGRGGKPTRPFKAYPRDPLSLTAGLQVSDALLPDANERNERFMVFRHHILSQTAGGAVQRRASGGSGAGVKRPASPAQQPSSSDAQTAAAAAAEGLGLLRATAPQQRGGQALPGRAPRQGGRGGHPRRLPRAGLSAGPHPMPEFCR
ncbi:Uncharacterized protein GBIM_17698 [Gryllus bimaculatus]|nr:Uncharacterized protein GBIM_17698 [Gryllus bimaculatus]